MQPQSPPPIVPVPGEPPAGPWRVVPLADVVGRLVPAGCPPGRPWVVAVDGRSAGGKSALAARLHRAMPSSAVVPTDDVAWHHDFFAWAALLAAGLLAPLHSGGAVRYRPPGWEAKGRPGAIAVPAGLDLVLVEGVGAGRAELRPWVDRLVWVQSDHAAAKRRGLERDGGTAEARAFWDEWEAAEVPFLARERPWERADIVVLGTPNVPHDPETEVVVTQARA